MNRIAVLRALAAAALFGLSTPAAKLLLAEAGAWTLAGILYCGAGAGLALVRAARGRHGAAREASLTRRDLPWLAAAIATGGVAGPVLLMAGLARIDGTAASLLLTLEGVATALLAWFAFRENFDRRIALGMAAIVAGAALLAWRPGLALDDLLGPALIVAACVAWGLDNNLTRKIALADPVEIAMLKGLAAGPVSLALGFAAGESLPPPVIALGAAVGFLGTGVSLVLYVHALRDLGTARTGAYFAVAPFLGAAAAVPLLGEALSARLIGAGALMAAGVWLHLRERHAHEHAHDELEHAHRHVHDAHHQHEHPPGVDPRAPHSHVHRHGRLVHAHAHTPDSHHRHAH